MSDLYIFFPMHYFFLLYFYCNRAYYNLIVLNLTWLFSWKTGLAQKNFKNFYVEKNSKMDIFSIFLEQIFSNLNR